MTDVVIHACNPSTQEAKAGGSWVPSQPRLHSETLSQLNQTFPKAVAATESNHSKPAPVAHACNPSYLGGRD
jgi:hypothetical protein